MNILKLFLSLPMILNIERFAAQTETNITHDSLPPTVNEQVYKSFHNFSVSKITKIIMPGGSVQYRLIATRQKTTSVKIIYNLIYDASGNLISKEKSKSFTYESSKEAKPNTNTNTNNSHGGHNHVH